MPVDGFQILVGGRDVTELVDGDLTYSNVDPGGYEACSFSFAEDVRYVRKGQRVFVRMGLEEVWQGRVQSVDRTFVPSAQTSLTCVGPGVKAKDNADFQMIFVDRDLSRWTGDGSRRRISVAASHHIMDPQPGVNSQGLPVLIMPLRFLGASRSAFVEALYDAGPGNTVARIFAGYVGNANVLSGTANWSFALSVSEGDNISVDTGSSSGDLWGGNAGDYVPSVPRRFAVIQFYYDVASAVDGNDYDCYVTVAVFGDHGLTRRGESVAFSAVGGGGGQPGGFYASDIASYAAKKAGIMLGVVEQTPDYIVYQSVYRDPVEHEACIADMGKVTGYHWGTWGSDNALDEDPRFHFRTRPQRFTCSVSRVDCDDDFSIAETLDGLFNVAKIRYQDAAGSGGIATVTRSIPELEEEGITRTIEVDLGLGNSSSASVYGQYVLMLSERNARAAGSAGLPERLDDGRPSCTLKSGRDKILVRDMPEPIFAEGFRDEFHLKRVEVHVGTEGVKTSIEVGNGADLLEVLQARLEAGVGLLG